MFTPGNLSLGRSEEGISPPLNQERFRWALLRAQRSPLPVPGGLRSSSGRVFGAGGPAAHALHPLSTGPPVHLPGRFLRKSAARAGLQG